MQSCLASFALHVNVHMILQRLHRHMRQLPMARQIVKRAAPLARAATETDTSMHLPCSIGQRHVLKTAMLNQLPSIGSDQSCGPSQALVQ